jgi:hypothetical protein
VSVDGDDEFLGGGFEAAGEGDFGDEPCGLVAGEAGMDDFKAREVADRLRISACIFPDAGLYRT